MMTDILVVTTMLQVNRLIATDGNAAACAKKWVQRSGFPQIISRAGRFYS